MNIFSIHLLLSLETQITEVGAVKVFPVSDRLSDYILCSTFILNSTDFTDSELLCSPFSTYKLVVFYSTATVLLCNVFSSVTSSSSSFSSHTPSQTAPDIRKHQLGWLLRARSLSWLLSLQLITRCNEVSLVCLSLPLADSRYEYAGIRWDCSIGILNGSFPFSDAVSVLVLLNLLIRWCMTLQRDVKIVVVPKILPVKENVQPSWVTLSSFSLDLIFCTRERGKKDLY